MYKEEDKNLIDTLCIKSIENILFHFFDFGEIKNYSKMIKIFMEYFVGTF